MLTSFILLKLSDFSVKLALLLAKESSFASNFLDISCELLLVLWLFFLLRRGAMLRLDSVRSSTDL